jgi:hypothetical protein
MEQGNINVGLVLPAGGYQLDRLGVGEAPVRLGPGLLSREQPRKQSVSTHSF